MSASTVSKQGANPIASADDIHVPSKGARKLDLKTLPGIIIFVHGVNSNGEWFASAEEGLCKGINQRQQRGEAGDTYDAGSLRPAQYLPELTPKGYLSREVDAENFVADGDQSPVIRFRWGYKASKEDLATVGPNILLDEEDAWGGGPFANGCSALPDLWTTGTVTDLFAGLQAQDMNTDTSRLIYGCPPRHYGAHAARRLAALVAQVRAKHKEAYGKVCPVTVVCHSQGNMVGMASAFIGKHDFAGDGVADTYVLANPPYSVLPNFFENFAQYNADTDLGRVTVYARRKTLDRFFEIVGSSSFDHASDDCVNAMTPTRRPKEGEVPWTAGEDSKGRQTRKHVFLYSNPHDQVISVSTVQGMGWLGLSKEVLAGTDHDMRESAKARGDRPYAFAHHADVLFQRVWAQGNPGKYGQMPFEVGSKPSSFVYYDKGNPSKADPIQGDGNAFWYRKPLPLRFHLTRVWEDDQRGVGEKLGATVLGGIYEMTFALLRVTTFGHVSYVPVNADPPNGWSVPINAPAVKEPIAARAIHLYHTDKQAPDDGGQSGKAGKVQGIFNQGPESHTDALNPAGRSDDVYDKYRSAGQGAADYSDEAALRYEHNASVRQLARRKAGDPYEAGIEQMRDGGDLTGDEFAEFREFNTEKREYFLKYAVDLNAMNHSTILTNPVHCEKVLAYDVDVGICMMPPNELKWLRQLADWRRCDPKDDQMKEWSWYYGSGRINGDRLESQKYYRADVPGVLGMDDERSDSRISQTLSASKHQRPSERDLVFGGQILQGEPGENR
ncbi:DUF3274 domain-containing protein [Cupriavidus sp. MP-37]|uniref:T6SS effector phospholipase Tle3 domain-containing protein n=1 Tax=Cupriavidus sp. MP-37 TaxID=2884455 RepID=UPI001D0A5B07|nr:DUF3274 domain-containing protein [Cupriavidus sp. MP-37]UDM49820.1 DUF3274 domain-containing protein [Cupriavidus sp. MP-37]